ncbi:MAG: hypothetical protein WCW14_04005, partial [Candidatus Paceibacterota bacterium]
EKLTDVEMSAENYEDLLIVKFPDLTLNELKDSDKTFLFSVTPEFNIYISNGTHDYMCERYGINPDTTLTEGYLRLLPPDKKNEIIFKTDRYQPVPGFRGSPNELHNLQIAVVNKIKSCLK